MKELCVLLSTYNGEKYIIEQLESIFSQESTDCNISVLIRDDGSKDNTVSLCRKYALNSGYSIKVIEGNNIGPVKSFLKLINICPDASYYAFCDQDDIWLPGKVKAAISELNKFKPALWFSNYDVVDSNLNKIVLSALHFPEMNPLKILFYNNVPGCVMIFNNLLLEEIRSLGIKNFRMHDILALDIAKIVGETYFNENVYVLYRQHGGNAIGFGNRKESISKWIIEKISYLFRREDYNIRDYAASICKRYNAILSPELLKEFVLVSNYKKKFKYKVKLLSRAYTKNGINRTSLSIRIKILLGVI